MRTDLLRGELQAAGWKNVGPARFMEWDFDLVGSRWFTFTKWNVLVKYIPIFSEANAAEWRGIFAAMNRASKSIIWGKCFVLCIVAGQVAPEVLPTLQGDSFGLGGVLRLEGGGGRILITDVQNAAVHGTVPNLPLDVHRYTGKLKEILTKLVQPGA